jgi:hypothetical protein
MLRRPLLGKRRNKDEVFDGTTRETEKSTPQQKLRFKSERKRHNPITEKFSLRNVSVTEE